MPQGHGLNETVLTSKLVTTECCTRLGLLYVNEKASADSLIDCVNEFRICSLEKQHSMFPLKQDRHVYTAHYLAIKFKIP